MLTRKITVLIVIVSFFPMLLTTGILFFRFNGAYSDKVRAHISELVQKHTQNIDTFLAEKSGNIRFLARNFDPQHQPPEEFLKHNLALLKKSTEMYSQIWVWWMKTASNLPMKGLLTLKMPIIHRHNGSSRPRPDPFT